MKEIKARPSRKHCMCARVCTLQTQLLLDRFSDDPLVFRIVISIELATVNVRATLEIRFSKHRNDTEKYFLNALDGAPPLRSLLVHQRVVARGVQDRDAHVAIWIDWEKGGRRQRRRRRHRQYRGIISSRKYPKRLVEGLGEKGSPNSLFGWNKGGSNFILNGDSG
jgi:hypothetical protein